MSDDGKFHSSDDESGKQVIYERPTGFFGKFSHPYVQVSLLGFVCFMGPGLFNALNGLGAGGKVDSKTNSDANTAVYSTFAVMAFFAGTVNNKLGSRLTLLLGTTGYSLYIASYLATNIHDNAGWFVIFAGAILGVCAGLLWTAQGSMMLSYATEAQKGRFIAIFWSIFNMGGVIGAIVALATNLENKGGSVGNGTYIGFLVLTLIGVCIPMTMTPPQKMIRMDGTKVQQPRHPSWKLELYSLYLALVTDPWIITLFPMFLASNWFYAWQFSNFNGVLFNIRTRSLNDVVYWSSQIVGSIIIGFLLDNGRLTRRVRAFSGWFVLLVMVFVVHGWAYSYQRTYTRDNLPPPIDFHDKAYGPHIVLYILMGIMDAMWQTTSYWLMGAMSNDPAKLAHFTGFYKSIQSAGGAGSWAADGAKVPFMNLFASTWALLAAGLVFMLPLMFLRIKDHTEAQEETLARLDDHGNIRAVGEAPAAAPAPASEKA